MVDDRPDPRWIEIGLDRNVGDLGDPMLADGDVVVGHPDDDDAGVEAGGQRRVFLVAATVGVLALVLGWLIGRSGGSGEVATLDSTAPVTTEAEQTPLLPGDTLPSAATTTTRPRRTTTTSTLAPPIRERVEVDPRLVGVELTLVGAGPGVLAELDLAAQTLTLRDVAGILAEPGGLVVGDDWVLIRNSGGLSYLVGDDGSRERVDLGDPWAAIWQPGTDRFWRQPEEFEWDGPPFAEPTIYEEIDLAGEPTGKLIELPFDTWSEQADPGGGLLVEQAGKLYSVDESSISLIGTGDLIALSPDVAVIRDCDEQLDCGLLVVDRSSGDVRPLQAETDAGEPLQFERFYGWFGPFDSNTISPDGAMCAVMVPAEDSLVFSLLDLRSGDLVELTGDGSFPLTVIWSPDSRFVFFIEGYDGFGSFEGGNLHAYDRRTGDVFPVVPDGVDWKSLAARPS